MYLCVCVNSCVYMSSFHTGFLGLGGSLSVSTKYRIGAFNFFFLRFGLTLQGFFQEGAGAFENFPPLIRNQNVNGHLEFCPPKIFK